MAELVGARLYSCCNCRNNVALHDDVISIAFQGRNGGAFPVFTCNEHYRHLRSGLHTVAHVYCCDCHGVLRWKYERAYEQTQNYKEGKIILEKLKIVEEDWKHL